MSMSIKRYITCSIQLIQHFNGARPGYRLPMRNNIWSLLKWSKYNKIKSDCTVMLQVWYVTKRHNICDAPASFQSWPDKKKGKVSPGASHHHRASCTFLPFPPVWPPRSPVTTASSWVFRATHISASPPDLWWADQSTHFIEPHTSLSTLWHSSTRYRQSLLFS